MKSFNNDQDYSLLKKTTKIKFLPFDSFDNCSETEIVWQIVLFNSSPGFSNFCTKCRKNSASKIKNTTCQSQIS